MDMVMIAERVRNSFNHRVNRRGIEVRCVEPVTDDMLGAPSCFYINPGTVYTGLIDMGRMLGVRRAYTKDFCEWMYV